MLTSESVNFAYDTLVWLGIFGLVGMFLVCYWLFNAAKLQPVRIKESQPTNNAPWNSVR